MLNKIVATGKTDHKCNSLLKISCYACYQDYCVFSFAKLNMLITTIGIKTIGTGMLGTIFGIEIVTVESIERTRDNTYIHSSFLNVNRA